MKVSTKGRYALRLMTDIAAHDGNGYVSLKDVAERQDISDLSFSTLQSARPGLKSKIQRPGFFMASFRLAVPELTSAQAEYSLLFESNYTCDTQSHKIKKE